MVILPMVCSMISMVFALVPIGGIDPLVEGVAGVVLLVVEIVAPVVVGTALPFSSVNMISGSSAGGLCFLLFILRTSNPNLCLTVFMCLSI